MSNKEDASSSSPAAQILPASLPSHPTARAFFDALDQSKSKLKTTGRDTNCISSNNQKRCSDFVQKRLRSLGWRNRHSQNEYYPVTVKDTNFSVRQVQRGEIEGTYGTGACVWPAALVLIKYLERWSSTEQDLLSNKVVVDLGSGTAITSVAAAILGARQVVCTDGEIKVVQWAEDNFRHACQEIEGTSNSGNTDSANGNDGGSGTIFYHINNCKINAQVMWWGRDQILCLEDDCPVDVVIVADCVLPKLYPIAPLVAAIDELLKTPSAVALLSYEHRYYPDYDPRDKFRELANERGLEVQVIPSDQYDSIYSVEDIFIWKVYRRSGR